MDCKRLERVSDYVWQIPRQGDMRAPAIFYADEAQIEAMDDRVHEQMIHVATLPGATKAVYVLPHARRGYGFPTGAVAAMSEDGVICASGVGFDIACGVRCLLTGLRREDVEPHVEILADRLHERIPLGPDSSGRIRLSPTEVEGVLRGGARWAVDRGWGFPVDLTRMEEGGTVAGAEPECASPRAKERQRDEFGTLGRGNHYLEVQVVSEVYAADAATTFGLSEGDVLVSLHGGARSFGQQIGADYLREMAQANSARAVALPDRELACAPIRSPLGEAYLGATRAAMNCALANRQMLTHLIRLAFTEVFPEADLRLLYDVSHNSCMEESHVVEGQRRRLFVHRRGATRAFGPGHSALPSALREIGQPVYVRGTIGTETHVLTGVSDGLSQSFGSACHGAARAQGYPLSPRGWRGHSVAREIRERGIFVRGSSYRGVVEEAPRASDEVSEVVDVVERAGLGRRVARVRPIICVKG